MADEENEEKNLNCIKNYGGMSTEKSSNDPIADIIGDVGRWQIRRILLLFLISIPGLAMIFSVPFVFNKVDLGFHIHRLCHFLSFFVKYHACTLQDSRKEF